MRWEHLLPRLQFLMLTRGHPKIIILHVGGNNVDSVPQLTLMQSVKDDLKYSHSVFIYIYLFPALVLRAGFAF